MVALPCGAVARVAGWRPGGVATLRKEAPGAGGVAALIAEDGGPSVCLEEVTFVGYS